MANCAPKPITKKEESACQAFIKCGIKTEAYRSAYSCERMKPITVNVRASELFRKPRIKKRIKELQKELHKYYRADVDKIIQETCYMAFYNPVLILEKIQKAAENGEGSFSYLNRAEQACVKGVRETKWGTDYQFYDKNVALERLNRMLGAYIADNLQKAMPVAAPSALQQGGAVSLDDYMDLINKLSLPHGDG